MASNEHNRQTAFATHAAERDALLDAYLRDTRLLDVVHACVASLARGYRTRHTLPANPYPSVLRGLRQAEVERAKSRAAAGAEQPQLVHPTPQSRLCSTHELRALSVWGPQRVLESANVPQLARTIRALQSLHAAWFRDSSESPDDDSCAVAIHSALEGACIDLALADHPIVDIERHVVVSAAYLERAMAAFARQLQECLHKLSGGSAATERGCVGCSGICFKAAPATAAHSDDANWSWSLARIAANRNAFMSAVKTALVGPGSSIEITTWDLVAGADTEDGELRDTLLQTTQRFSFHFAPVEGKGSTSKQPPASRMLPSGQSRVLERGVFLSERGASELSTRLQQPESGSREMPHAGFDTDSRVVLSGVILEIERVAAESRWQWMGAFVDSFAFVVLRVVLRNRVLLHAMRVVDLRVAHDAVEAHVAATHSFMQPLLEQARVGARSSLLASVEAVLRAQWRQLRRELRRDTEFDAALFADALTSVNELLLLVARAAAADFARVLHRSSSARSAASSGQTAGKTDTAEQVDVVVALQSAIGRRAYPLLVAFEAVFAQYLVDSCVDVALESAVTSIVAFHLPPNPFVELSQRVCAFVIRQHMPRLRVHVAAFVTSVATAVDGLVNAASSDSPSARPVFSGSASLLELLDTDKLWRAYQWLTNSGAIRESGGLQPPKSSYSLQTFHSLLVFHPIAHHASSTLGVASAASTAALQPLVEELEVVEHLVVEGKAFAQALGFFAAAVIHDLKRLTAAAANAIAPSEVTVLDPEGKRVSDVECVDSEDAARIQQLVQEATVAACVVRIRSVFCDSQIVVVGKSYLFHFQPLAAEQQQQRVAPLLAFRLQRFGVFFALQHAQFVLWQRAASDSSQIPVPRESWTPDARDAIERDDLLLQYELECALSAHSTAAAEFEFRRRLVAQSCLLPLFSIEAMCALALAQLGRELSEPPMPAPGRGADVLPASSFSHVFAALTPKLADQLQRVLEPLNADMGYIEADEIAARTTALRHLESDSTRLRETLRRAWLVVLYARFSYQRALFAHLRQVNT